MCCGGCACCGSPYRDLPDSGTVLSGDGGARHPYHGYRVVDYRRSARVCHCSGDGGALRCGRRHLRRRDVLDVRVVHVVVAAFGLYARGRHEDERPNEAHRACDREQVPAHLSMPGRSPTRHGNRSRPLDSEPRRQRRYACPACHEHRGRARLRAPREARNRVVCGDARGYPHGRADDRFRLHHWLRPYGNAARRCAGAVQHGVVVCGGASVACRGAGAELLLDHGDIRARGEGWFWL